MSGGKWQQLTAPTPIFGVKTGAAAVCRGSASRCGAQGYLWTGTYGRQTSPDDGCLPPELSAKRPPRTFRKEVEFLLQTAVGIGPARYSGG